MRGAAQYNVPFRQGARFRAGISIVNNGRFTVRVLGISGEPPFDYLQLAHRHLTVSAPVPKNAVQSVRPDRTFRPLDLPPGEAMFLQLNGTYNARCRPVKNPVRGYDGGSQVFAGFDVRYTVLWRTRTVRIDFPDTVSIEFPDNENCFEDGS
jgi:hypothetical protein